jgi:Cdc6-like AAA superfamily ATPase
MIKLKTFSAKTHKVKILIYGDTGTGKTVLSSTAPNPVYICSEN